MDSFFLMVAILALCIVLVIALLYISQKSMLERIKACEYKIQVQQCKIFDLTVISNRTPGIAPIIRDEVVQILGDSGNGKTS